MSSALEPRNECIWTPDPVHPSYWHTSCGQENKLCDFRPRDIWSLNYCSYCGGRIVEKEEGEG